MFITKLYIILLFLNFFIVSNYAGDIKKTVYVSSSAGSDANAGGSIDLPLKTIERALSLGDTILLKRGDVFFERVSVNGKYIGAYGQGEQPMICGFKRPKKSSWISVGHNLWMIDLTADSFGGFILFQ